eukprot:3370318-Prymnesium_polylepis.1
MLAAFPGHAHLRGPTLVQYSSGIDSVFRDVRRLVFTKNTLADGNQLEVPFKRREGMFKLT